MDKLDESNLKKLPEETLSIILFMILDLQYENIINVKQKYYPLLINREIRKVYRTRYLFKERNKSIDTNKDSYKFNNSHYFRSICKNSLYNNYIIPFNDILICRTKKIMKILFDNNIVNMKVSNYINIGESYFHINSKFLNRIIIYEIKFIKENEVYLLDRLLKLEGELDLLPYSYLNMDSLSYDNSIFDDIVEMGFNELVMYEIVNYGKNDDNEDLYIINITINLGDNCESKTVSLNYKNELMLF